MYTIIQYLDVRVTRMDSFTHAFLPPQIDIFSRCFNPHLPEANITCIRVIDHLF